MLMDSSAIRDIRYDDSRGKLFVTFDGGDEYVYVGVPEDIGHSFLEAASKGGFFSEEIRDRFPYNRL